MRGGAGREGGDMRRLLRWIFNGAAAVWAVLFVGVCLLWMRSYRVQDHVGSVTVTANPYDGLTYERRDGLFSAAGRVTCSSTDSGYTPTEWALRWASPPATNGFGWSTGDFHDFWEE